jgi:hypothetical protein
MATIILLAPNWRPKFANIGRKQNIGGVGFGCLVMIFFFWVIISFIAGLYGFIAVVMLSLVILTTLMIFARNLDFQKVQTDIQRYHKIHPIEQMVDGKAFVKTPDNGVELTPKISSLNDKAIIVPKLDEELFLAPEQILIVERDEMVDMLIRNRFHLETKTVVVSQSGYPTAVFEACPQFVKNNPKMPVQVLHDASVNSFGLLNRIRRDPKWQFARDNLVDIGLTEKHLGDKILRPWFPKTKDKKVIFSKDYKKMLQQGRSFPIDGLPPKLLLSQLSAAVVAGVLTLAIAESFLAASHEVSYG